MINLNTPLVKRGAAAVATLTFASIIAIGGFEGSRTTAYIPVKGDVPTIGYGHTEGVEMGDRITELRALQLLGQDANVHANGIRKCITAPVSDYEFGAFVSLSYNIGVAAFCRHGKVDPITGELSPNLIDLINAERYPEACERIKAFKYGPGRKVLPGLVKRRDEESAICKGERQNEQDYH